MGPIGDTPAGSWEYLEEIRAAERQQAEEVTSAAVADLAREGVTVTAVVREGEPAHQILLAAEEFSVGLIVLGSKGLSGIQGFLLGSVARNVARHALRPVVIARAPRGGVGQVVLAVDGSSHAEQAGAFLCRLPLPSGARVTVTHVVRPVRPFHGLVPTDPERLEDARREGMARARERAAHLVEEARLELEMHGRAAQTTIREGDPAERILEVVEECGADLIVAGARGVSPIRGLLVGSVADRLVRHASGSVLLVR
jgi:nucleotide-binding universal stress UspA family protein